MLDAFTKKKIENILDSYIEQKVPKHARDQVKLNYKIRGDSVTLFEERVGFRSDQWIQLPVAQFRRNENNKWTVYWQDSKDRWHPVDEITPEDDFELQLQAVDRNNQGVFWK